MVCKQCGSELVPNTKFCPICGTPVAEAAPAKPVKKSKAVIVAIAAACVAVIAAVVVVAFIATDGFNFGGAKTVTFGQKEEVPAALSTVFKPQDKKGDALKSYLVALVRQGKKTDGVDEALYSAETTPYRLEITHGKGFSISDFGKNVPSGRYACYIVEERAEEGEDEGAASDSDGDQAELPAVPMDDATRHFIIDYAPDNQNARDELTVLPTQGDEDDDAKDGAKDNKKKEDSKKVAYKLYKQRIDEYIAQYGEPSLSSPEGNGESDVSSVLGLAVVSLRDFDGDGIDELVLCYRADGKTQGVDIDSYAVEVWAVQGKKLKLVYNEPESLYHSQDALTGFEVATLDGTPVIKTTVYGAAETGIGEQSGGACYAYNGKTFEKKFEWMSVSHFSDSMGWLGTDYTVDGEQTDEAAFKEAMGKPQVSDFYMIVGYPAAASHSISGTSHLPSETVAVTNDTIAKIKEAAGAESSKDTEESDSTAFVAKDVKQDVDVRIGSDPVQPVEKETTQWSYPQFFPESGKPSKALSKLNTSIKEDFDKRLRSSQDNERSDLYRFCSDSTVSIQGNIACVRQDRMDAGSHPVREVTPVYYDLTTGKTVSMADALGIGSDELVQMTVAALNSFLSSSRPAGTSPDLDAHALASDSVNKGLVYRTEDALVAIFPDYSFGSYGAGNHEIVIKALTDKVNVGDDLVGNYKQPEEKGI